MSVSGRGLKITIVPSKHSGHCMCHLFQHEKEPVFSLQSECVYGFLVIVRINSYYFTKPHKPIGLCNEDVVCLL